MYLHSLICTLSVQRVPTQSRRDLRRVTRACQTLKRRKRPWTLSCGLIRAKDSRVKPSRVRLRLAEICFCCITCASFLSRPLSFDPFCHHQSMVVMVVSFTSHQSSLYVHCCPTGQRSSPSEMKILTPHPPPPPPPHLTYRGT